VGTPLLTDKEARFLQALVEEGVEFLVVRVLQSRKRLARRSPPAPRRRARR
jgi:hypothetical protein